MRHNYLNKTLSIYKCKKETHQILILISLNLGWCLYQLQNFSNKQLEPLLFGYSKLYKFFFKLKGFGYKWKYLLSLKKNKRNIFFKLGFTHRISLVVLNNLKIKLKKRRLVVKHRSISFLRDSLKFLFFLYKTYLYNKKGIYLRGTKYKLKISKKKSKF